MPASSDNELFAEFSDTLRLNGGHFQLSTFNFQLLRVASTVVHSYGNDYLCGSMKSLHEQIIYSTDVELINSPAFYDCCIHLICNSGTIAFKYNDTPFRMEEGDIAVISYPRYITEIEGGEGEYIAAPNRFLHNLLPANNYSIQGCVSLFDNPVIKVDEKDAGRFRRDIENIRHRIGDVGHHFYREMIGSLLQTMIYDLFDFHSKNNENVLTTDRIGYIVSQFFTMMEAGRPKTEREVSYYAEQLNVTPKYLSDTIKRVTGASVSSHINRAATSIMTEYLRDSKLSITQIADEMNFTSVSYFSRYCTKHLGISPAQFRLAGDKSKS